MFDKNMVVTNIRAVVLYDSSTFATHENYSPNLPCCELIYNLKGENIVNFAGRTITETDDCIRYLPKGNRPKGSKYTVDIIKPGKCIDVYFDTNSLNPKEMLFIDFYKNPSIRNMFIKMQKIW